MGFHICEYCKPGGSDDNLHSHMSSGDVTLIFASGRGWAMPDMIKHYVADHGWRPPQDFIDDVMRSKLVGGQRLQTKGGPQVTHIAYLSGPFERGEVPEGFMSKLSALMDAAAEAGNRQQYRGAERQQSLGTSFPGEPK